MALGGRAFNYYSFYCDEAGNTGSNYIDLAQPIHVLAGWVVSSAAESAFQAACTKLRATRQGGCEAHAHKLLRSTSGRAAIADFIDDALTVGARPLFIVAEKRFCIAAKIIETFLDPAYNQRAEFLPTGADSSRQSLANLLFDVLPDKLLATFFDAYRNPSIESFLRSIEALTFALHFCGHSHLAWAIEGNIPILDKLVEIERMPGFAGRHGISISINLFTFVSFVMAADQFMEDVLGAQARLVHDESKEFRAALEDVFRLFSGAANQPVTPYVLESGRRPRIGIRNITEFSMAESHAELSLQGADMLATAVKTISMSALRDEPVTPPLDRIAKALGKSLVTNIGSFDLIASEKFSDKFVALHRH